MVAGFYPAGGNQPSGWHVYTLVVSAAFRTAAALLLFSCPFLTPMARPGERGGGGARPAEGQAGPRGGGAGGGRIGIGDFFRGRFDMPAGTALIRGIVTSDTGVPVRRAQVRANI